MKYRAEVDGIRSLAVLSVVFYHFDMLHFRGGFLGVDVFFVISGYLISFLLYEEVAKTGTVSFKNFWLRRARRILPAMLFMLAAATPIAWWMLYGTSLLTGYSKSVVASVFSASNFLFFSESGYFDALSINKPLLHTWSLAVEEQFYLFFPFLVFFFLVKRQMNGRGFFALLLGCTLLSWIFCLVMSYYNSSFAFFMLPTRLWEIMAGSVLAWAVFKGVRPIPFIPASILEVGAVGVALYCLLYAPKGFGVLNAIVVLCTLALLYPKRGLVSSMFALRPFVVVGKISYSLYLWHWPAVSLGSMYWIEPDKSQRIVLLLASVLFSFISFRFVESKFRRSGVSWKTIGRYVAPVMLVMTCVGVAGIGTVSDKLPVFETGDQPAERAVMVDELDKDEYLHAGPPGKPAFALVGDSHAQVMRGAFMSLADEYEVPGAILYESALFVCPEWQVSSVYEKNSAKAQSIQDFITRHDIKTIFIAEYWEFSVYSDQIKGNTPMAYKGGLVEDPQAVFVRVMDEMLGRFVSEGRTVYIIGQVPRYSFKSMERAVIFTHSSPAEDYTLREPFLSEYVKRFNNPRVRFVSTKETFRDEESGEYIFVKDNKMLFMDYNHITNTGAMLLRPLFEPVFKELDAEKKQ